MNAHGLSVSVAGEGDREAWNRFCSSSERSEVYHRFEWKDLLESVFSHRCYYLIARESNSRVVGVFPLAHLKSRVFGNFLVSLPCFNYCGVLAATETVYSELIEFATSLADELGASHVEIRNRSESPINLPVRQDKVGMQLRLTQTEDELWNKFPSKLRAQIRRPKREGATCVSGGAEQVDRFYEVFSRNMRDLGTPVYPRALFSEILERFPSEATMHIVDLCGQPVAAGLTISHRDVVEVPFASSLRQFNRFSVNMLLYWTMIQRSLLAGFRYFDFGRSSAGSGQYRFKKQWGATATGLEWQYILTATDKLPSINPDNPKYRFAINLWKRLPVTVANAIGPHVVRHLP